MSTSEDTEITLGTGRLVSLFFGLVCVCTIFFALGYSLGKKSETVSAAFTPGAAAATSGVKPAATGGRPSAEASAAESAFRADHPDQASATTSGSGNDAPAAPAAPAAGSAPPSVPTGSYSVQVAAVSHQEDADALAEALRKKQYTATVVAGTGGDKFFHVQVGPFADLKDAETMKARLVSDGYNPIVKK